MIGRSSVLVGLIVCLLAVSAAADETALQYVSGILDLTSSCFPQGIKLDAAPIDGIDWPDAKGDPLFAELPLGEASYPIMMDRHDGTADLYVDADRSGNFQFVAWDSTLLDGRLLASVTFEIAYDGEQTEPYQAFVIWSRFTPTVITYCRDSYRAGVVHLGDRDYKIAVLDDDSDGRYDILPGGTLAIDVDGDGQLLMTSDSHEIFSLAEPFNLNGTVYKVEDLAEDGSSIRIATSDVYVPPKPPLLAGFPAPLFEGEDTSGDLVSLKALRGDIVVLDFWASWCGPCVSELPTMNQIAADFSDRGVDVVGIDLDRSDSDLLEAIREHELTYRQVFDSDAGPIGALYRIAGIPMTYVIDRTGTIYARGLRGDALIAAVQELVDGKE